MWPFYDHSGEDYIDDEIGCQIMILSILIYVFACVIAFILVAVIHGSL